MLIADKFTNVYPVSKTLRFELRPVGKTQEYIERDGVINTDITRAENYLSVKKIIDQYHMAFIERGLTGIKLSGLDEYALLYMKSKRSDIEDRQFEKVQDGLRKQIVEKLKKESGFGTLFKKELIKQDLPAFLNSEEDKKLVEKFSDFTTYFTGFNQNRENMYSSEPKSTAIGYRVIHQNLPKYIDNMKVFKQVMNHELAENRDYLERALQEIWEGISIADYFELDGFNLVISQSGIDIYNTILGGYTKDSGEKIQGLNEYVNLYNQANGTKLPKFKQLFKQILSDRETVSFVSEQFEADEDVFQAINYIRANLADVFTSDEEMSVVELLSDIKKYDLNRIYIRNDISITSISQELFGDWSVIKEAVSERYDQENSIGKMNPEKYDEKKKKVLNGNKNYSIGYLNECLTKIGNESTIEEYFEVAIKKAVETLGTADAIYTAIDVGRYQDRYSLKKNDKDISKIKQLLDAYKEIQKILKPLIGGMNEADKEEAFYAELSRMWDRLDVITLLYNKVRNYVTSKPYSTEKVKLNFDKSTLLDGWDKNKERDNLGMLFLKDGLYYLGIMNRNNTRCIENAPKAVGESRFQKMEYKLLPGPNKMLPKVFFASSNNEKFNPSEEILAKYKKGTHKKGDLFNIEDCRNLIDYFKQSISIHEDWSKFGFEFSDTRTYQDISGFYREVEHQGYKITFTDIDESYISRLVDEGSLYLFMIYNKDFSVYSKGTPNLHTMYWKALFSEENLNDVVYKLNGGAEVFFRRASIRMEQAVVHPANEMLKNKDPLNEKKTSTFTYDIVKDRRFTCDKYQLHVPITINAKADGENRMNVRVNKEIRTADNIHIIGIDRGERNLLYVSVVDMDGKIVEQMSLNQLISYDKNKNIHVRDFHYQLTEREKENVMSRQNWTTIGSIKELKEGYLSQVIHVITELMIKYNAIVVLEDLNFGFKQGRQKFERQVYQKFEKMLIDKLNFYVDKKKVFSEPGGLMKGYQLTAKFDGFQKMGKQTGFLFYVPAWNTSKLDPTTGFVNLFYTKYESVEKTKNFIRNMNRIYFDEGTGCFAFEIDYSKFTYKADQTKCDWVLYSYGERIDHFRNPEKNSEWDVKYVNLTEKFDVLFKKFGVDVNGTDITEAICKVEAADFYKSFMKLFALMLQMRNSDESHGVDQIISPVRNKNGKFFVSGTNTELPMDADANGAYNIAKKGLFLVKKIQACDDTEVEKIKLAISNKEWLQFAQENTL